MTHGDFMKPVVPAVSVSVMTESKSHVKESVADLEGLLKCDLDIKSHKM